MALEAPNDTPGVSLVEAAVEYGRAGWPVLPLHSPNAHGRCTCHHDDCGSPAKHPRTMNGLSDATTDELSIRRWWKSWPDANIGLVVPRGAMVLDIDGAEGHAALREKSIHLPPTAVASTGRGYHYVYATSSPVQPRVGLLPKVDVRGPGSYIVAAPSRHITGAIYRWDIPLSEISPAPAALENLAIAAGRSQDQPRVDVATVLEGVPEGQRDQELFRLASKLRYADVPYDTAEAMVLDAAAKCVPPFAPALARAKVQSAYGRYEPTLHLGEDGSDAAMLDPETCRVVITGPQGPVELTFSDMVKTARDFEAEMSVRMLLPGTASDAYIQRLNLMSPSGREACRRELDSMFGKTERTSEWGGILARACTRAKELFLTIDRSVCTATLEWPGQVEHIVEGLVSEDGCTIFFGSGSSTKTYQAADIAVAVSRGEPWIGRATQKRNVLVVDYETGRTTFTRRMHRLMQARGLTWQNATGVHYFDAHGIPLLDQHDAIRRVVERHNIGLLVVDHAALCCGGEPETSDAANRTYRALAKIGLPSILIAHITGDGMREASQVMRPFGSVFWHNGARMTWFLQRTQEEESDEVEVGFFNRKDNDGPKRGSFGVTVAFDGTDGPVSLQATDIRTNPVLQATRGTEYQIREALLKDPGMTYEEIAEVTTLGVATVRKSINRHQGMFRANDLKFDGGGRGNKRTWEAI